MSLDGEACSDATLHEARQTSACSLTQAIAVPLRATSAGVRHVYAAKSHLNLLVRLTLAFQ